MLCNFAGQFPEFVGDILERERSLGRRFREETFSDLWVAGLVPLQGLGLFIDLAGPVRPDRPVARRRMAFVASFDSIGG